MKLGSVAMLGACFALACGPNPGERAGRKIDSAAQKTGKAVKKAGKKTGEGLKKAGQKLEETFD